MLTERAICCPLLLTDLYAYVILLPSIEYSGDLLSKSPVFYRDRILQLPEPYIDTIDSVMDIIVTLNDIVKVILFGSCSRGTLNDKSDIDLLLLIDSGHIPFIQLEQKIGETIYEKYDSNYKKPVDFLFADFNVFNNCGNTSSLYRFIKKEGVTIYE